MRVRTIMWVHAYMRRCRAGDAAATVVRHGDDDAGAVFIKVNALDGRCRLYSPAPAGLDGADDERRWLDGGDGTEEAVDERISREAKFDSDLWVIEVEDRRGRSFLDGWLTP